MRALVLLLLLAVPSRAEILPSFWLDSLAWRATHIVVATEGEAIDGKLVVKECLAGTLKTHSIVELPGLARFADEGARTIHEGLRPGAKRVDGRSMVLFLVEKRGRFEGAAEFGGVDVSTAWLRDENAYALVQVINPGAQVMSHVGSRRAMFDRISLIRTERSKLEAARALPDAGKRVAAIAARIDSAVEVARSAAVISLGNCGPGAMPVLERLIADPERVAYHGMLVEQLARAGGAAAAPRLVRLLESDLRFWTKTGPALSKGWWNGTGLEPKRRANLQQQYSRTLATLRALKKLEIRAAAGTATRFADFWRSLPQLHDKSGLDQMTEAAEAVARLAG